MTEPTTERDLDRRVGRLEGFSEQVDRRLATIEQSIAELRTEIRDLRNELSKSQRWIIGIQITTLIALGSLILGLFSRLP